MASVDFSCCATLLYTPDKSRENINLCNINMRAEIELVFRFTLTRSILLSDLLTFRDFLVSKGHEVGLLNRHEGGIDFSSQQEGGKYLRWHGFSAIGRDGSGQNFVHNPSTIAREYLKGLPEWHRDNTMQIDFFGFEKFSEDERCDIREGMVECMGVIDNVIYNRTKERFVVLSEDESRYVDIFLEFDRERELQRWTVFSPHDPDTEEERLFQCWRCKEDKSEHQFDVNEESNSFYIVLEGFVTSNVPCCLDCAYEVTICNAPLPRNVLVSSELTKKRRKT